MAESIIAANSYVRWPLKGGFAFGKVTKINSDTNVAFIETPTGAMAEAAFDSLIACDEDEYQQQLEELASSITKKTKRGSKMKESTVNACDTSAQEVQAMKDQIEAMKKELGEAKQAAEAAKAEAAELVAKLTASDAALVEAKKVAAEASEKFDKMEKAAIAKDRYSKLEKVEAATSIASDETSALAQLGDMSEATFTMVFSLAESAFKKLTAATKSSLPKSTDQSESNQPKATEAKAEAAEALSNAKSEGDANLATAGSAVDNKALSPFIGKMIENRRKNRAEKK